MKDYSCDVLVVGGGVTGVAAAIASGRTGAKTVLLESRSFVGGNATTGLAIHNYITRYGRQVVFGIAQEMIDRLIEMGGAVGHIPYGDFVHSVTPVDGHLFRILSTKLLEEAGVTIIYGTTVIGVEKEGERITEVRAAMKGGIKSFSAKVYIDASGDADVIALAGGSFNKGHEKTGKMQPVSMILNFFGTDNNKICDSIGVTKPALAKKHDLEKPIPVYFNGSFGKWNDIILKNKIFPNKDHKVFFNTVWANRINVNTSAVIGVDGTDPWQISKATGELTQQSYKIGKFLVENVPGFENSSFAPAIFVGVRETRIIEGVYKINQDDVEKGRKHKDGIGQISFPVDIHDPDTGQASFYQIGDDGAFDIPFRSMIPVGIKNTLVAGRAISATTFAHGATRNMAPCLVSGQGAGTAAALAVKELTDVVDMDSTVLRQKLHDDGVYLGD